MKRKILISIGLTLCFCCLFPSYTKAETILSQPTASPVATTMPDAVISPEATKAPKPKRTPKPKKTPKVTEITISAAGDCTLSSDIKQPASVNFFSVKKNKPYRYFFRKVKPIFAKDDMTLVNFEGTLSDGGSRADKQWAFRGKPSYINILKQGSVEAVCFSNNHTRDYGEKSHQDTIHIFKKHGISYSTETKTSIYKVKGVRIGLVSISSVNDSYNSIEYLKKAMRRVKKKKPTIIIVSMHSGTEHTQVLQPLQKQLGKTAIDMGADLVLGHHPHVMQGIQKYKGKYIVYSLGNFCFGGNTNPSDKDTFIYQETFVIKKGKLVRKKNAKVIPCRLSGSDSINNYQPVVSKGAKKKNCLKRLRQYSKPLGVTLTSKGLLKKTAR